MNSFSITLDDGEEMSTAHIGLSREEAFTFLDGVEASRFSIAEYDEEDELVIRMNGQEWLNENTEMQRVLKP